MHLLDSVNALHIFLLQGSDLDPGPRITKLTVRETIEGSMIFQTVREVIPLYFMISKWI